MAGHELDLDFPDCCAHCPHLHPVTETCGHDSRQALVEKLGTESTCPVYSAAKTEAMQNLSESLADSLEP